MCFGDQAPALRFSPFPTDVLDVLNQESFIKPVLLRFVMTADKVSARHVLPGAWCSPGAAREVDGQPLWPLWHPSGWSAEPLLLTVGLLHVYRPHHCGDAGDMN